MRSIFYMCLVVFTFHLSSAQVIITEIMYNPPEPGMDTLEYLEFYNNSNEPVDMTGWTFTEGLNYTFPEFVLAAESYITICVRESAFRSVFGDDIPVFEWTSRALVNGGELLEVADADGNTVISVDYKSGANGWYTEADGNGASLELCNFAGNPNDKESWRPSENPLGVIINERELFGTPGAENSVECSVEPDHIIEVGSFFFDPEVLTIQQGETVRWINTGGNHNVNGSRDIYPDNPVSFSSGNPSSEAWTYDFLFSVPGEYTYRCDPHAAQMVGMIIVEGEEEPELPLYSIGALRSIDADGVGDSVGVECAIIGIAHGINIRPEGSGIQFTLIDTDGDGIGLFNPVNDFGYNVTEGDELRVEGTVEQFRGLLQMNVSGLEVLSEGNELMTPLVVTELGENTENRLVTIENVSVVDPSDWTNSPGGFTVRISNASDEFEMRIPRNAEVFNEAPSESFNITGIGGQFSATAPPFLDGYQILPRYSADFDFIVSTLEHIQIEMSYYPNPASDLIFLESEQEFERVDVYDMSGKLLVHELVTGRQVQLNISSLNPGQYIMTVFTKQGFDNVKIQVIK